MAEQCYVLSGSSVAYCERSLRAENGIVQQKQLSNLSVVSNKNAV